MKKDNQKLIAGILIGAAAGTAITLFLQGKKGKEFIATLKDSAKTTGDGLKEGVSSLQYTVDKLFQKGKKFLSEVGQDQEDAQNTDLDDIFS